jgi:hypothetical protein
VYGFPVISGIVLARVMMLRSDGRFSMFRHLSDICSDQFPNYVTCTLSGGLRSGLEAGLESVFGGLLGLSGER